MEPLDSEFRDEVLRKITSFNPEQIREAIQLTELLSQTGSGVADDAAQLIHDVALHAESMEDWAICARLYLRVTGYTVSNQRIPVGAWFRHGLCSEKMGNLAGAIASYRKALQFGDVWPQVTAMTRIRLSELLMAAEEYEEAASVLEDLMHQPAQPDIHPHRVQVNLARCLYRTRRWPEARRVLERLGAEEISSEFALEGLKLLAEVCEYADDFGSARDCYQRIFDNTFASAGSKAAAAHRLAWLQQKHLC